MTNKFLKVEYIDMMHNHKIRYFPFKEDVSEIKELVALKFVKDREHIIEISVISTAPIEDHLRRFI